ncbi:hypothetical protein JCM5350_008303 [Sporobolomyces pararoseus]
MDDLGDFKGRTPLEYWLEELTDDVIHPTSAKGLTARLIILLAFTSLYVVLAFLYGVIAARNDSSRFWLARLVSGRHESRYLVLNPRIFWSFGAIVNGFYSIACIVYYYYAFSPHGAQYGLWATRSFGNLVFFIVLWPMSWCPLQAYLISSQAKERFLPSPRIANAAFALIGLGFAGASLAVSMIESRNGREFYHRAVLLQSALQDALRQSPSGFPTAAQTIELAKLSNRLSMAGEALNRSTIVSASFSPLLPISCLIAPDPSQSSLKLKPSPTTIVHSSSSGQVLARLAQTLSPEKPPLPASIVNLQRAKSDVGALTLFLSVSCMAYITALVLSDIAMTIDSAISSARKFSSATQLESNFASSLSFPVCEVAFLITTWQFSVCAPLLYLFLIRTELLKGANRNEGQGSKGFNSGETFAAA